MWYACLDHERCRVTLAGPGGGSAKPVVLAKSVGLNGANLPPDVLQVQEALNAVSPAAGGADPKLATDSLCGPKTIGAIRAFQKAQFPEWPAPDARIDPGMKTVTRLNQVLAGGSGPSPRSAATASALAPTATPPNAPNAPSGVTLVEILKAYSVVPEALGKVREARRRLMLVQVGLESGGLLPSTHAESAIADWNFKVGRAQEPGEQVRRILRVYDRMAETLFMVSRASNSFHLFLPSAGSKLESSAAAYTSLGGFFRGLDERDSDGAFLNAIYITPQFANKVFAAKILIHELAHYCGGIPGSGQTIEHRASPIPPPRGRVLEDGRTDYEAMTPDLAFRNAQSYQAYCYPETDGKPPA